MLIYLTMRDLKRVE